MISNRKLYEYLFKLKRKEKRLIVSPVFVDLSITPHVLVRAVLLLKYILDNFHGTYEYYIAQLATEVKLPRNTLSQLTTLCLKYKLIELKHMSTYSTYVLTIVDKELIEELYELTKVYSIDNYILRVELKKRLS